MAQSGKEQLQAYRFMQRRVRTALLDPDPDTSSRPLTRIGIGTYAGITVALLVLAIAGIVGIARPTRSTAWRSPGAYIIDGANGARYVYIDDQLHPVFNDTSARLLLGGQLHVVTVAHDSLSGVRRGDALGIPGAPDLLPDTGHLAGTTWSACVTGTTTAGTRLSIQPGVAADGIAVGATNGLLLVTSRTQAALIWNERVYPLADRWLPALGYTTSQALPVPATVLTAFAQGPRIDTPLPAHVGKPGPTLLDNTKTRIGEIVTDTLTRRLQYLVTATGLTQLTPLQTQIAIADPAIAAAYPHGQIRPVAVANRDLPATAPAAANLPASPPPLQPWLPGTVQLCTVYSPASTPRLVINTHPATTGRTFITLTPGNGALATTGSSTYLVTDTGQRFAAPDLAALGYTNPPTAEIPAALLQLIPTGPTLDPTTARHFG